MQHTPQSVIGRRYQRSQVRPPGSNRSDKWQQRTEAGQTFVEYTLILTLLSITLLGTSRLLDIAFPDMGGGFIDAIASLSS